jgi:murein DD-endopeptidase MepM/ murein hydrolase activator NlpD
MTGPVILIGMPRSRLAALSWIVLALAPGQLSAIAVVPATTPSASEPTAAATPAPGWTWPVSGMRSVTRPFIAPPTRYGAGHRGVDLAAPGEGSLVVAATSGVVHFAGRVVDRGVVTIRAGQLLVTVEPVTASVATGDVVRVGGPVGTLEMGHCAEACVHVGVREAGEYVSPMRWLGGLRRAVLLPLSKEPRETAARLGSSALRARVSRSVDVGQPLGAHMGVDLSRGKA